MVTVTVIVIIITITIAITSTRFVDVRGGEEPGHGPPRQRGPARVAGPQGDSVIYICIYIYIYGEREREREI